MSGSDGFIEEVTQEVRRDRLNLLVRRYGWIAVVLVVAIVGVAAVFEWRGARQQAAARNLGDAMLQAVEAGSAESRRAALEGVAADGDAAALRDLLIAGELAEADPAAAAELLGAVAERADVDAIWRDLATLKLVMLPGGPLLPERKLELLAPLGQPGAPFRLSALEQTAHMQIALGRTDAAMATLTDLAGDVAASPQRRRRAEELLLALGAPRDGA